MTMVHRLVPLVVGLLLVLSTGPACAQTAPILAHEQILIVGVGLQPFFDQNGNGQLDTGEPIDHGVVPKNIATAVNTRLIEPSLPAGQLPPIPTDAVVVAELRGPAFGMPVSLTARPNEPIPIPPLALSGLYTLDNIRLVRGSDVLLQAVPDAVTIEVIDQVLVSQVTARPLTAQEIKDKGIVIDQDNFQVFNFTAAFGVAGNKVNIDFPIIIPNSPSPSAPAPVPALIVPALQAAVAPDVTLPQLQLALQSPNVSVSGLLLRIEDSDPEIASLHIPPLPGVVIIPGNVAYLNQFFSVMLMVSNVAPGASNLVVRDVTAEIVLPVGADTVPDTSDDPLRMARLGNPPVPQSKIQPVTQPGADGRAGTADDLNFIAPQQSAESEHLVEGRKEGTHTVEMLIKGTLVGLPVGPVTVSGKAVGVVEVRNPTFALTFSHAATVSAGEEYDFLVTATNTSTSPANFLSLNLLPRSISGATLLSSPTVQVDTVAAGDSFTASFRLLAQQTGSVVATSIASEGIPGSFDLTMQVGALGIPLSPNTLSLPSAADALPAALRAAGVGFLSQALALATSPVTPTGLLPITRQIVFEHATELAQAGQRLQLQEPLLSVAARADNGLLERRTFSRAFRTASTRASRL